MKIDKLDFFPPDLLPVLQYILTVKIFSYEDIMKNFSLNKTEATNRLNKVIARVKLEPNLEIKFRFLIIF